MIRNLAILAIALGLSGSGYSQKMRFSKFEGIYEPSGVQQLAGGRFIVVQDESAHPFDLITLKSDGVVEEIPLYRRSDPISTAANHVLSSLEDLEAVASDNAGFIYAITSHSRKEGGKRAKAREQLVRFRLNGEQFTEINTALNLRKRIIKKHPALKRATKLRDVKEDGGFNIEGLSFDAQKSHLLIGLRAPQTKSGDAIIVTLENPQALFDAGEKPQISDQLIEIDLRGGGVRGLAYDPHLGGYLIISRRTKKSFKLWFWNGEAESKPKRIKIKGAKNLRQAEGVTPVLVNGRPQGILIVSDDGHGVTRKAGKYLFVRYEQLSIK